MEGEKSNYSILGHVRAIELAFPLAKGESRETIAMFQPVLKSSTAADPLRGVPDEGQSLLCGSRFLCDDVHALLTNAPQDLD